jgi:peptide/nickel transport system permease protein
MAQRTSSVPEPRAQALARAAAHENALNRNVVKTAPGLARRAWRQFRRNKVSVVALGLSVAIVLFTLSANLISEYVTGYDFAEGDLRRTLEDPFTEGHILGTDPNGRDLLTRVAFGGRISLQVATLAALSILLIGGTAGAVAGYFGGKVDSALMRLVDVILCLPGLAVLLLVSTIFRPGPVALSFVIAIISWPTISRLVRGEVLSLRERDFVDAARVIGASDWRIILRHIFPNVVPIIVVWISLAIPGLILTEAALSFLGFGVQIPIPSWGNMLQDATSFYTRSWWNVFLPGFAIYITVLSINLVGNGLRDALDPRLSD